MKIQVIGNTSKYGFIDGVYFSMLPEPRSLDEFDFNIIDLSNKNLWQNYANSTSSINQINDLISIQKMVERKKNAAIIYALPPNLPFTYHMSATERYLKIQALKDIIHSICNEILLKVIPEHSFPLKLVYENTRTMVGSTEYEASFFFEKNEAILTKSLCGLKPTTIKLNNNNVYATTLGITQTVEKLRAYLQALFPAEEKEPQPEWMSAIVFGDDVEQNAAIKECEVQIEEANKRILAAENKLKENARIKSILYTNGDELVSIVFMILEKLLNCDLSEFIDEKKEDFLIKFPDGTFIGEIKGVTSNVKYEHISQLELHYRGYLDQLAERGVAENVKQLLIMNPFRTKPLEQRDQVHIDQINLAVRNECLIIETHTLLRVYERFCSNQLTSQHCKEIFKNRTGLLSLSDFDELVEDLEP